MPAVCCSAAALSSSAHFLITVLAISLQCIWALVEFLTKFATVRAAITGEAFFEAGRNVTDLLRRNFLKAFGALPSLHSPCSPEAATYAKWQRLSTCTPKRLACCSIVALLCRVLGVVACRCGIWAGQAD